MTSWAAIVLLAALYFGGGQVAPCLGLNNAACVRAWEASHPHPPPLFDTSLAWPWIALLLIGLTVIQVAVVDDRPGDIAGPLCDISVLTSVV